MAYNACFDGLLCFDWQLFLNLTQKTKSVVALNLKTALILKVFNALRQAKIACFQYLASTKFNANQNQQQYLALKFLYFKFKLLIYDPKLLKTSKQLPNAIKTLLLASKACQRNNKIAKKMALPPALLRPSNSTLKFNATKNSIGMLDFKFISKTYFDI